MLQHQRTFGLPALKGNNWAQYTFHYSLGPIAYRPLTNTLIVHGHNSFPEVAEISIPGGTMSSLIGDWFDPSQGEIAARKAQLRDDIRLYAMWIDEDDRMFCGIAQYYNVALNNDSPFFWWDLRFGKRSAMWGGGTVAPELQLSRWVTRLSPMVSKWCGKRYGGGCTTSQGVSGSSYGPNLYFFDLPDFFEPGGTINTDLAFRYSSKSPWLDYYPSWEVNAGMSLPDEMLWVGRRGLGDTTLKVPNQPTMDGSRWYGESAQTFVTPEGGAVQIKDAQNPYHGYHSTSYKPVYWSLSNSDLINGNLIFKEVDLSPYLKEPGARLMATYDWIHNRVFILEAKGSGDQPLIHIFDVV